MKPLARVRRAVKVFASRHMLVMEFCHDCGRRVRQVWTADDALWSSLADGQHPLCIGCFDHRAERAGHFVRWIPTVEEKP